MSAPGETGILVTEPGLYPDIPEEDYHADPVQGGSLSVSGSKLLIPPGCPAVYDHERRHPRTPTRAMDFGTAAHALILGKGQDIEVIDADSYRTRAAQEQRDKATDAGRVPLLAAEYRKAQAVEAAVRDDDDVGPLFDSGDAEMSGFCRDPEFGIWLRMRTDWLTYFGGQPLIVDVKTCADASPAEFARSVARYRYDMQDVHYRQVLAAILGCDWRDIDFVFVAVPTAEPYLVMTYRLENERDLENGLASCREARERYRACTESGLWPKWSAGITPLELPVYARRNIESSILNEYYS